MRRIGLAETTVLGVVLVGATYGLDRYFERINDAAPLLDAFTTAGSIVAQYMLARKYLENCHNTRSARSSVRSSPFSNGT